VPMLGIKHRASVRFKGALSARIFPVNVQKPCHLARSTSLPLPGQGHRRAAQKAGTNPGLRVF
jgi:hypothetical protein